MPVLNAGSGLVLRSATEGTVGFPESRWRVETHPARRAAAVRSAMVRGMGVLASRGESVPDVVIVLEVYHSEKTPEIQAI